MATPTQYLTVRSVRYRYIRTFIAEMPYLAPHLDGDAHYFVFRGIREFAAAGRLTPAQGTVAAPRRPGEGFYDRAADPFEECNLAHSGDLADQSLVGSAGCVRPLDRGIRGPGAVSRIARCRCLLGKGLFPISKSLIP